MQQGTFDLKLVARGAAAHFGRDELEACGQTHVSQGADCDGQVHALAEFRHFRLVDVTFEEEVVHIGHSGDRRSVVEGVAHRDGITHLDRNVQNCAVDGRAHEGGGVARHGVAHAFFHYLECIFGIGEFFALLA